MAESHEIIYYSENSKNNSRGISMRKFSSYGPVDKDLNFYVPRKEMIDKAVDRLIGEDPEKGGHYITVWAPRQCGKTWIMNEVLFRLAEDDRFCVLKLELEYLKMQDDVDRILKSVAKSLIKYLNLEEQDIIIPDDFHTLFMKENLDKPLILIIDEFDALAEDAISSIVSVFRHIYNSRKKDPASQKEYLLHSVALIGVRSVLGIENVKGSPFNVQRSLHIPNLTCEQVASMFRWYEQESGQNVAQEVTDRIFYETRGQPGLTSWLGELLTEGFEEYKPDKTRPISTGDFEDVYAAAVQILPNNNILNIISKAKQEPYKEFVLELFKTGEKIPFKYDDPFISYLYMNGVIDNEKAGRKYFVRFSCPFVQKRLFNYFSNELFQYMGKLFEPFEDVTDIVTKDSLHIGNLMRRYEKHLQKNRDWMLKNAPRRSDMRIFEAVFHFNLYEYLVRFFESYQTEIWPEFPTGNGKVDIMVKHGGKLHALELKSYRDKPAYDRALKQAAEYAASLKLNTIHLIVFVEYINDEYRLKYETDFYDKTTGVVVVPVFVATGN